jgi:hypothetical protein
MRPYFPEDRVCRNGKVLFRGKEGLGDRSEELLDQELGILAVQEIGAVLHEVAEQEAEHVVSIQDSAGHGPLVELRQTPPERRVGGPLPFLPQVPRQSGKNDVEHAQPVGQLEDVAGGAR